MPVNAFGGTHGWGYDGVLWYAVHETRWRPDGLVRLRRRLPQPRSRRADRRGVQPSRPVERPICPSSGPYLSSGGNPWGESINLADADADEVRRYIIDCALRWMRELTPTGCASTPCTRWSTLATHILEELATETDALAKNWVGRCR